MQITIDTKHDSPDEIRKAISLLQSLVSEFPAANFFDAPTPSQSVQSNPMSGLLSIFGNDPQPQTSPSQVGIEQPKIVPYDDDPLGSQAKKLLDQKVQPLKLNRASEVIEYY